MFLWIHQRHFLGPKNGIYFEQAHSIFEVLLVNEESLHFSLSLNLRVTPAVPRTPPRNIQVYNPTPNSLNVRWEPATGQVHQYRVAYAPLSGSKPTESVSNSLPYISLAAEFAGQEQVVSLSLPSQRTKEGHCSYKCKDKTIKKNSYVILPFKQFFKNLPV